MSGIALTYDLSGVDRIAERIGKITGIDRRDLLDVVGATVESQTRRRLSEEKTAPDGTPWKALSEAYKNRKKGSGGILEAGGGLIDSMDHEVSEDAVEIGSNLIYSRIHQLGSSGEPVTVPAHVRVIKKAFGQKLAFPVAVNVGSYAFVQNIPARPYLGVSDANETEIIRVVDDYLDKAVNL